MSTSHSNIYITLAKMLYGYSRGVSLAIKNLCSKNTIESVGSPFLDEIISRGPATFQEHPTAIGIGRALFSPLILISHLYDKK